MKERLLEFLEYSGLGQNAFEVKAGISKGYITNFTGNMTSRILKKIRDTYPDLNIDWLKTGNGSMLNLEERVETSSEVAYFVRKLPTYAMGGPMKEFSTLVKDIDCEQVASPIKGADWAITVNGDSMAPEYPSGSMILIKKIDDKMFIDWGKTYVLDTCNGTVIKRLFPSKDDDKLKCVSINTEFSEYDIPKEAVYGIYRILMCMSIK